MTTHLRWPRWLGHTLVQRELVEKVEAMVLPDEGHGYDRYGLNRDWLTVALAVTRFLYERYFRVLSYGVENVPATGGAVLAANHSGTLPLDALMIWADIVRRADPARVPRAILDNFVAQIPFVSTLFSRAGAVGGTRGDFLHLLEAGELILVFPEGSPGIGKLYRDRYQLQDWRVGHAELAIRHQVPVVPIAVVGAEEQWPQIGRLPSFGLFGAPHLPVVATPLPMPVRYHIHYGEPIPLHERFASEDADDPAIVAAAAAEVRAAVEGLLEEGLARREGVFS